MVTFECNGMEGEPVTWTVDVEPKTLFSYWPNKTTEVVRLPIWKPCSYNRGRRRQKPEDEPPAKCSATMT